MFDDGFFILSFGPSECIFVDQWASLVKLEEFLKHSLVVHGIIVLNDFIIVSDDHLLKHFSIFWHRLSVLAEVRDGVFDLFVVVSLVLIHLHVDQVVDGGVHLVVFLFLIK